MTLQVVDAEDPKLGRLEGIDADGRVTDPARRVTYVPAENAYGTETFHFVACDGFARDGNPRGCSAPQAAEVTVASVNDRPVARDAALTVAEDESGSLVLSADDVEAPDADDLDYELVGAVDGEARAANGTVTLRGRQATYIPDANYHGPDSFRYRVTDAEGETAEADVAVTVSAVNDVPVIEPGSLSVDSGERGSVPLRATDADGDPIAFSVSGPPGHGQAEVIGENATYAPDPGFDGEDSFTVRASDPTGAFADAPITVSVRALPAVQPRGEASGSQVSAPPPVNFGAPADPPGARVRSVRGRVALIPPGAARRRLTPTSVVPAGSLVDTTAGAVVLGVAPGETLRAARGRFTVAQRTERHRQVVELVLRGAAPLDVLARCRCRVVTPEARIEAFQPARWLIARRAAGTRVRVLGGRVRVTGNRARTRWLAAGRTLTVPR